MIKAIRRLWNDQKSITSDNIHQLINQTKHSSKRHGAAATLAMVSGELDSKGTIKAAIMHVGDSRVYWQPVSAKTDLQAWLINLKNQVYDSDGNAYDDGTAILVRFD